MLAELVRYSERAALIERSGIQFMDFGLNLELRKEAPGEFVLKASRNTLARLEYQERDGRYVCPGNPPKKEMPDPRYTAAVDDSFKLLLGCWLPVPFLRGEGERGFSGPTTWARGRIVAVAPGEDVQRHSHRLTLAFDTNVIEDVEGLAYLAPIRADVQAGASFRFTHRAHEIDRFIEQPWVIDWLGHIYAEQAAVLRIAPEELGAEMRENKAHIAHYLNWLSILGERAKLPEIVIRSNARDDVMAAIPVDMVLDVGNSRTCGILIEEHPQQGHGLKNRYELALRDLSQPERAYAEPFESRVEFAQVILGKEHCAAKSGRNDAFIWPTIARVGPEAARLANRRRGTEGSTGLSSPKRYLWDEDRYQLGWRFNVALSRDEIEPHATGAPFSNLINDEGNALYAVEDEDQRMPVFMPHYSRSAMMTFMLAEVLTQALVQINSPGQRLKQGDPEKPRHLRSVILTVPPSMPKPERDIFAERMEQAMVLVWKSLGWHGEDLGLDEAGRLAAWPPFPTIHSDWDEATCAQVVYLFSECQEHFAGRPEDFFRAIRRPGRGQANSHTNGKRVTFASIDIGGGTTDLVVTDYTLDAGQGANVYIRPVQRFRDGFKLAGDDVLLEIVQKAVIPDIEAALRAHGVSDPAPLLSRLIGSEPIPVQDAALRQQLALQILYPLGLHILKLYEQYDPVLRSEVQVRTIAEMLAGRDPPSPAVLHYFCTGVRQALSDGADFDLSAVPVTLDLCRLHRLFLEDQLEICKTIQALCEIVWLYDCDILLLSGRPSRLPGVQALFRALLALPPDRILPLHGYRAGTWYPFHKDGRIDDPKTTAAVGAMVCKVGGERGIPNFNFLSNAFRAYSTVRYIGLMDRNMRIKDDDVCYSDVRLDDENYELPDEPFEVRGRMVLGFRQLASERWGASPLYVLDFTKRAKERLAIADRSNPPVLLVRLKLDRRRRAERFEIMGGITSEAGTTLGPRDLTLKLNTLNTVGIGETDYWLDSGSVIR